MAEQCIDTHRQRRQRHGTLLPPTQSQDTTPTERQHNTYRVKTRHPQDPHMTRGSPYTSPTESARSSVSQHKSCPSHRLMCYTCCRFGASFLVDVRYWVMLTCASGGSVRHSSGSTTATCVTQTPNLTLPLKLHTLHASYTNESMADQEPRPNLSPADTHPRFTGCVVVWRLTCGATVSVLSGARASSGSYSSRHSGLSAAPALPIKQEETEPPGSLTTRRHLHNHRCLFPYIDLATSFFRTPCSWQAGTHACEVGIATTGRCSPFISSSL